MEIQENPRGCGKVVTVAHHPIFLSDAPAEKSTMICCEEERITPFCPICGHELMLEGATLKGLLAHIRAANMSQLRNISDRESTAAQDQYMDRIQRSIDQSKRSLEKWTIWERELNKLLEGTGDDHY